MPVARAKLGFEATTVSSECSSRSRLSIRSDRIIWGSSF